MRRWDTTCTHSSPSCLQGRKAYMAALANSGVPTVNPALNVKQQLALAILGGQGTATQMLRERRKHMVAASQPKGMCVRMCLGHHFVRVCVGGVGGWGLCYCQALVLRLVCV